MHTLIRTLLMIVMSALASGTVAQPTSFTYQGRLKNGGALAEGQHDFRFRLFDAPTGGTQVGTQQCVDNLAVTEGVFTASLDFGQLFDSTASRFIEIEVRRDAGLNCASAAGFVVLAPRQLLTAAPTANHAKAAFSLDAPDGTHPNAVFVDNAGNVGVGTTAPANRLTVTGNANITGNVGIGTTNPGVPLHIVSTSPVPAIHVASPFAAMNLQDTGADSTQTGYISYRNKTGTETAWIGFGSAGDPDFSIVNARAGGDIVLNPFSGNVGIGTATPLSRLSVAGGADVSGSVGIGTSAPAAKLDVRGSIKLGSAGQYYATSGSQPLGIVRGYVRGDGSITYGEGFSVDRLSSGTYRIHFTTPFLGTPVVIRQSQTGHLYDGGRVYNIGGASCDVQNGVETCGICDGDFTFIAIGVR